MNRAVLQYTVNDFLNWHESGELVLVPYFQRRDVWARKAKSSLVDTVIRNLPIPIIIIRESINPKTGKTIREVVDGQQRIRSLLEFYNNELPILKTHNKDLGGLTFVNLPPDLQHGFRTYMLSVNALYGASDAEVLDIFARLNSYMLTLNNQEKLNSRYHGEFKTYIYRESSEFLEFFRSYRILSNARIIRMGEAEFFSELIVAMIDGLQHGKSTLEGYYKKYDDDFPDGDELKSKFATVISKIEQVMGENIRSTIYRKSNLFYSLFGAFFDLMYGMKGQTAPHGVDIPESSYSSIVDRLSFLSEQAEAEVPSDEFAEFKLACTAHLDNLKERTIRHRYVKTAILHGLGIE
jgi:hypothetical protein